MKPNIEEINNSFTNKIWELKEIDGEWGIYARILPEPFFRITSADVIVNNDDGNGKAISSSIVIPDELLSVMKIVQDYLKSQQLQS